MGEIRDAILALWLDEVEKGRKRETEGIGQTNGMFDR